MAEAALEAANPCQPGFAHMMSAGSARTQYPPKERYTADGQELRDFSDVYKCVLETVRTPVDTRSSTVKTGTLVL